MIYKAMVPFIHPRATNAIHNQNRPTPSEAWPYLDKLDAYSSRLGFLPPFFEHLPVIKHYQGFATTNTARLKTWKHMARELRGKSDRFYLGIGP
jgi:hypothetical protein